MLQKNYHSIIYKRKKMSQDQKGENIWTLRQQSIQLFQKLGFVQQETNPKTYRSLLNH